jgi:hypothetical protein
MELHTSGIICTKHKLWKKKQTVLAIISDFLAKGYNFQEMVYGEPNDFVFTEKFEDVEKTLSRKGSFFGIRIKFTGDNSTISIDSNTMGIDNVRYDVFAETKEQLNIIVDHCKSLKSVIGSTSESITKSGDYLGQHPTLVKVIIVAMVIAILYFIGVLFFITDIILMIFSFAPILFIFLIFAYFRRR